MLLARGESLLLIALVWVVTGVVRVLVVDSVSLRWDSQSACVVDVQEVTFKFGKGWERFVVQLGSTDISVKALVRGSVEMVVTATANSSLEEIGVRVWNSSVVAVASENADAIQIRGCDFLLLLFQGVESFSCSFHVIRCQRCTMAA
jgi:hypothetical protein